MMGLAAPTAELGLILLLLEAREILGGAHSLCLNFTLKATEAVDEPPCAVEGTVDGKLFLQCDSDGKNVKPVGVLGEKVKGTDEWKNLTATIRDINLELTTIMHEFISKRSMSRSSSSMQVKMCCQVDGGKRTGSFLEFNVNNQKAVLDTMTNTWTVVDPGATAVKEKWESNTNLVDKHKIISSQHCGNWLMKFLVSWKELLYPTAPPKTSTSSTSKAKETIQRYPSSWLITWIMPFITILFYLAFS